MATLFTANSDAAIEDAAGNRAGLFKIGPFFLYSFHAVPELVAFYALALIHYLDNVAHHALMRDQDTSLGLKI